MEQEAILLSKLGTVTPKHFNILREPQASVTIPTGVWDYHRVPLRTLFPQLGSIPLSVYYKLRIACCGRMLVTGASKLQNCHVCIGNHGYVCPACLGMTATVDRSDAPDYQLVPCSSCCYERVADKGHIIHVYDAERELQSCQRWLARKFPYGVPSEPTPEDLARMDSL